MTALVSIVWTWTDDGAMCPMARFRSMCDRELVIGEHYRLQVVEERSEASHNHYFARLHDLWLSLPDNIATQFPTENSLRKHALIMTGFRREKKWVAADRKEARKLATWMEPEADDEDYAIISINENVVVKWTALSQSRKGMPVKGQFYESKTKVLEWVEDLIGVEHEPQPAPHHEEPAPVPQDNAPSSQLAERLRALAEHLHFDAPEDFEAALTQARVAGRLRQLERDAPKQTTAVIDLCRKAAGGMFDDAGFEEVLGKILADATSHAEKRRAA